MKRFSLFFLFLLTLFVSCAAPLHYQYTRRPENVNVYKIIPVYLDVNFGNSDQIQIDDAINVWNYALNSYIKLKVVSTTFDMEPSQIKDIMNSNGIMILKIMSSNPIAPAASSPDREVAALTDSIGGHTMYIIKDRIGDDTMLRNVAMHELGHLLGAEHTQGHSLMQGLYSKDYSQCVDKATIMEVAKYQGLDPNELNYCKYDNDLE